MHGQQNAKSYFVFAKHCREKFYNKQNGADSYTAMKRIACNNSRWKAANQSKDLWIRRRKRTYQMPFYY